MTPVSKYKCVSFRILFPPAAEDNHVRLSFWYNMYGFHIGTLEVCLLRNGKYIKNIWKKTGPQSMNWKHAEVTIVIIANDRVRAYILVSLKMNWIMFKMLPTGNKCVLITYRCKMLFALLILPIWVQLFLIADQLCGSFFLKNHPFLCM